MPMPRKPTRCTRCNVIYPTAVEARCHKCPGELRRGPKPDAARRALARRLREKGKTYAAIGALMQISRQAAAQLASHEII